MSDDKFIARCPSCGSNLKPAPVIDQHGDDVITVTLKCRGTKDHECDFALVSDMHANVSTTLEHLRVRWNLIEAVSK